jgi:hypothetical protein
LSGAKEEGTAADRSGSAVGMSDAVTTGLKGFDEDVECGGGVIDLACVDFRGWDAAEVSLGFDVSPPVYELRRGIVEFVFGCLLGELVLE